MSYIIPKTDIALSDLPYPDAVDGTVEKIVNSFAVLDKCWPGWEDRVDATILDMIDSSRCLFGQATGNYCAAFDYFTATPGRNRIRERCELSGQTLRVKKMVRERQSALVPVTVDDLSRLIAKLRSAGYVVECSVTPPPATPETVTL